MATATNTLTQAVDFTVDDWYALPRAEEAGDPGWWWRAVNLSSPDPEEGVEVRLFGTAERPVPVVDVWTGSEVTAGGVRALAAALLHVAGVIDEIARREAL